MAKFLNGSGVQSALTDIITNAEKKLLIISPYLNIPVQTKNYLKSIDKKGIPSVIIHRTNEKITKEDLLFFDSMKNLTLGNCENLHSKCYINDSEGLITSMNLYEHSVTHNWEMGIRFSKQHDPEIYRDVVKELNALVSQAKKNTAKKAFCMRCREPMPLLDLNRPLCLKCYRLWAKYKNWQYEEKYCHSCGSDTTKSRITFEKPLCKNCSDNQQKK